MTSLETSEYFIPSVPIDMPSEIVGTPKSWVFAPADRMDNSAASTKG
jgi:hypothetical protein